MIIQRGEQTTYLNHELIESVVRHVNKLGKVSYTVTMASGAQREETDAQLERFVTTVWPPVDPYQVPDDLPTKPVEQTIKEILADETVVITIPKEAMEPTKKRKR